MRRRRLRALTGVLLSVLLAGSGLVASANDGHNEDTGPVTPDPAFLEPIEGEPCTPEGPYEQELYGDQPRYEELGCKRIRFAYGPIVVKPGQNEAVLEPVDIEQPRYDGYIVRFKPDLVRALDGGHPRTEDLHLHHATWLNLNREYGDGPFFAAGEEKTIANFPAGYGMEVRQNDLWGLLYMVHNATAQPETVWLTYQIDFIPKAAAEQPAPDGKATILPVKPLWLDVQKHQIHPDAPSTGANPVFNVQRGYGTIDDETGAMACRWPDQNCARFDMYGQTDSPQMGRDIDAEAGEDVIKGTDITIRPDMAGTIIGLGGHMHPGGVRIEVDQVRDGYDPKTVFISDALYWDFDDPARIGAKPHSWNLSMTVTGLPLDWAIDVKPGDKLRMNAIYDTSDASWYENMGIVVALVAPELHTGDNSVDVFAQDVTTERSVPAKALTPDGNFYFRDFRPPTDCVGNLDPSKPLKLCLRGSVTHGAVDESGHGGGCGPNQDAGCPELTDTDGPIVTDIHSVGFTYGNADLGVIGQSGIPRIVLGETARFWSYDTVAKIWHTFTRCAKPCNGGTGVNYPIANADGEAPSPMDFDSGELGLGILYEPSKSQLGGSKPYDEQWLKDAAVWEFTPTDTGTYTFWCRIHAGMRGAFKVITPEEAAAETTVLGNGGVL